jgi:hypothetical protein
MELWCVEQLRLGFAAPDLGMLISFQKKIITD